MEETQHGISTTLAKVDGGSDEDLSEHIVCEFFDSMLQEIKDECGIPVKSS